MVFKPGALQPRLPADENTGRHENHNRPCLVPPPTEGASAPRIRKRGLEVDQGRVLRMAESHDHAATRIAPPACPNAPPDPRRRAGLHAQSSFHEKGRAVLTGQPPCSSKDKIVSATRSAGLQEGSGR